MNTRRNCIDCVMSDGVFFENSDSEKISKIIEKLPKKLHIANKGKSAKNRGDFQNH